MSVSDKIFSSMVNDNNEFKITNVSKFKEENDKETVFSTKA